MQQNSVLNTQHEALQNNPTIFADIHQSLVLWSIVTGWILRLQNWSIILSLRARTTRMNLSMNERTSFLVLAERKAGSAPATSRSQSPILVSQDKLKLEIPSWMYMRLSHLSSLTFVILQPVEGLHMIIDMPKVTLTRIDSMFLCVCSLIDPRWRQNMTR